MKKIKKLIGIVIILMLILSLSGCYYNEVIDQVTPPVDNVSFANDIQPIFNQDCIACHNGTLNPDLREGKSYIFLTVTDPEMVVPFDSEGSELYQRINGINGSIMPPSGSLSNTDISLVRDWIEQGALNN